MDRYSIVGLVMVIAFFSVLRLPTLFNSPGAQDEEWYGVPGFAIAQSGVPSVPYCRADEEGSVFLGADEMLFAQPPLSFYAQAPFFYLFSSGNAAARMASFCAACIAIVIVYAIGQLVFKDRNIALIAALTYSMSRLLYFPAVTARPDMICGLFGLMAVAFLFQWNKGRLNEDHSIDGQTRWLILAGISVALAGLSHPFALVFAIQTEFWVVAKRGSWKRRIVRVFTFNITIAATFSLWLLLIMQRPDLFREQFIGNILRPAGPGLFARFLFPSESFLNQIPQLFERAQPIQFSMLTAALIIGGVYAWRCRLASFQILWWLAITSVYLLVVCVGIHPIQGFWCYSAALAWLCFAKLLHAVCMSLGDRTRSPKAVYTIAAIATLIVFIPGSGLRATTSYIRNWNDSDYSVDKFVASILESIPDEASITAGPEFSLEVLVDGRDVILACENPMYFDSTKWPTDYLIIGRRDFEVDRLEQYRSAGYSLEFVNRFGNREDIFCNYAEVWWLDPPGHRIENPKTRSRTFRTIAVATQRDADSFSESAIVHFSLVCTSSYEQTQLFTW